MRAHEREATRRGAAHALLWLLALRGALASNNDKLALTAFYEAMHGVSWGSNAGGDCRSGWLSSEPCDGAQPIGLGSQTATGTPAAAATAGSSS